MSIMRTTFLFGIIIFSLNALGQGHNISIQVDGIQEEYAIIGFHLGERQHAHDTVYFDENNTIQIKGDQELSKGIYFLYTPSLYIEFLVVEQEFELKTTLDGGYSDMEVSGSRENELFATFQKEMISIQQKQKRLADSLQVVSGQDSITVREELVLASKMGNTLKDSLINENPDTFFSRLIGLMRSPDLPDFEEIEDEGERKRKQFFYYKANYFDGINDPSELLRTPVFSSFVMKYFDELVVPQPDSLIQEIDNWISKVEDSPESFRYWIVTFFKKYQESNIMGMDKVWVHVAEKYYLSGKADWLSEESLQTIRKEVRFIKPNLIGSYAPLFSTVDTAMQKVDLWSLDNEYLIFFFYDPDCGHCRKKTPVLRESYERIQELGGEVVAICTISDVGKWKRFIKNQELEWINVGDPNGQSNFRVDYNVRTTPQLYVLDKEKKIIAKKLDVGDQLITFLEEYNRLNP